MAKPERERRSPAVEVFLWSRAAIWAAALLALLTFEPNRHPLASRWDDPDVTRELGYVLDVWARWDSVWYLRLAEHGYGALEEAASAFYPLYPTAVGLLGRALAGHYVLAGVALSLAACLLSFVLLHRIAEDRLGPDGAARAVLYLAVFPMSLFLQAVYAESLYLALVLAAFLLAERGRFLEAAFVAGLALLTRPSAIALLPSLALLAWRSRDRLRALGALALAPALFALYPLALERQTGDALAFTRAQEIWQRELHPAGPLGGLWEGLRAAWHGAGAALDPDGAVVSTTFLEPNPVRAGALHVWHLAFLCLFAWLAVVAWRRFGAPYGLFAVLSLAVPLSVPSERWPLLSLPRFGLVVFPIFLALAALGSRPRVHAAIVGVSGLMLGVAIAQWALWQWVS